MHSGDEPESLGRATIGGRFNGPPDSANGGYACGTLARFIPGPSEVTLRVPPPLDTPFDVVTGDEDGSVRLMDGETLVAEGRAVDPLDLEPPVRPGVAEAADAQTRHPFLGMDHPFSRCFVCGAAREDGLGLHFGPLADHPHVNAAVLRPDPSFPAEDGRLASELLWGALDCPSFTPDLYDGPIAVLGRLSAELLREVDATETLVAVGWPLEVDGRRHHTASALIDADDATVARASAVWIRLREA